MCWRLILEEFGPELKYIKGENNVIADALSRLKMSDNQEIINISELYGYNDADLPYSAYPIRYHNIAKAQETDAKLQQKLVSHKDYTLDTFRGGDKDSSVVTQVSIFCYFGILDDGLYRPHERCRGYSLYVRLVFVVV